MSTTSGASETFAPIEPGLANLILSGVNRLDCALTALGCVMKDLKDDPEKGDAGEVQAIRWLYEILWEEALNIRKCVAMAQGGEGAAS
jgi:hypothetical protein